MDTFISEINPSPFVLSILHNIPTPPKFVDCYYHNSTLYLYYIYHRNSSILREYISSYNCYNTYSVLNIQNKKIVVHFKQLYTIVIILEKDYSDIQLHRNGIEEYYRVYKNHILVHRGIVNKNIIFNFKEDILDTIICNDIELYTNSNFISI